jgi:hypothetical protein
MKIRVKTIIVFGLAAMAGGLLLYTSQEVQRAEQELRHMQSELAKEIELIRVLNAEWAYLSTPERLEELSGQYLDLAPEAAGQILPSLTSIQQIETREQKLRKDASFRAPLPQSKPSSNKGAR